MIREFEGEFMKQPEFSEAKGFIEELRRLAEVYKHFRDCRECYADRLTAEREVARAG